MAQDMMEGGRKTDHSITGDREGDTLEAEELDQAGNVVTSYVASGKNETGRIDVVVSFPLFPHSSLFSLSCTLLYFFYLQSCVPLFLEYCLFGIERGWMPSRGS